MAALMSEPGTLLARRFRPPMPGDGDAIARADMGWTFNAYADEWIPASRPHVTGSGRDCESCPAPAEAHGEWGSPLTGCQLSRAALVVARRRRRG